jgi:hypothetical protein
LQKRDKILVHQLSNVRFTLASSLLLPGALLQHYTNQSTIGKDLSNIYTPSGCCYQHYYIYISQTKDEFCALIFQITIIYSFLLHSLLSLFWEFRGNEYYCSMKRKFCCHSDHNNTCALQLLYLNFHQS